MKASPVTCLQKLGYLVAFVFGTAVLGIDVFASEGPIKEVALPEGLSSAQAIDVDPSGRIWFAEKIGKTLTFFEPAKGEFKTFPLPSSWGNVGVSQFAVSPEGDIWFTVRRWAEDAALPHLLGRLTPGDGFFTKYVLSIDAVPEELLVDGDGRIWFVASNKDNLYRVDLATLAVRGYPVPTANGNPRNLAVDEKGQIWFAEPSANKIVKFVPELERFHEYEIPTPFANPGKIAIDKDGKVWFVESNVNRIAVFYPDRVRFDEAIIPTMRSAPESVVVDENGNVWFLEYRGNKVGVFTPGTAVFREYAIPTFNSLPGALAIDRERGTLWFSEGSTEAKRLGMLSIDEALAAPEQMAAPSKGVYSGDALPEDGPRSSLARWGFLVGVVVLVMVAAGWVRHSRGPREGAAT